jgi:uncharacterized protein YigE (DUF2233 family)
MVVGCMLFVLTACDVADDENAQQDNVKENATDRVQPDLSSWYEIAPGLSIREYERREGADAVSIDTVTVLKIDPKEYSFEVKQDVDNPKDVGSWRAELGAVAVINGGYFLENFATSGFIIVQGDPYGVANRSAYQGMFVIDQEGNVALRDLKQEPYQLEEQAAGGIQSFPLLVYDGRSVFLTETNQASRRSMVALDEDGNVLFIVNTYFNWTLYQAAQWLVEMDLGIQKALNLDGGSSTGLSVLWDGYRYSISSDDIPHVVAIFPR